MIPYLIALSLIYPFWWAVTKLATLKQPIYVTLAPSRIAHRCINILRALADMAARPGKRAGA
jgi:hypothetical protein